jgi:serine/threonine protein kinase
MSESLGRGSIFAGCRLEAVVGRGGMGVVFRATQPARQRRVALKVIAPEFAADKGYRARFVSESRLAASVHHPNVIPVYEAGELDGRLYVIMRWVEGTDLRALLEASGRVSAGRAIGLLVPVASALAAAHRRGLVHRDVKPANVLIARGDQQHEDHIYVSDFGIARLGDGRSGAGVFVGTIDYAAPERLEGAEGDSRSDIYSLGCVLFEVLTGHVPFERPTDVSKISAHVNDPVPSARDEVGGVPEQLDAVIAKAMAKRPEDRFGSAGELTVALGHALQELETAKRVTAAPKPQPSVTSLRVTETTPAVTDASAAVTDASATVTDASPAMAEPSAAVIEPSAPGPAQADRLDHSPRAAPRPRRSRVLWAVPIAVLAVAGVLIATLTGGGSHPGRTGPRSASTAGAAAARIKIIGSGLTKGRTTGVPSLAGSISVGRRNVWISLPDRGELVRLDPLTGARRTFVAAPGSPTVIAAGSRALWVAETVSSSLVQFNGDSGAHVAVAKLTGSPTAIALDQQDSSAWVADSSGAISHVALGGAVIGTPAHSDPAATSIGWGEGWLWVANGAANGLVRVSLGSSGSSTAYRAGPRPVGVALDQGVWTADANGHVIRFDPRPGHLRVDADIAVAPELDAIAATDPGPFVWAISRSARTLYRVTNTSTPAVTGTVAFGSPPVALAVTAHSVWVGTQDDRVTQIRF